MMTMGKLMIFNFLHNAKQLVKESEL